MPLPEPNQMVRPAALARRAKATSSRISPATLAWPPIAAYASLRIIRNWPFAAATGEFGSFTASNEKYFASRQYTNGTRDFSYQVFVTCSGEKETRAAFFSF